MADADTGDRPAEAKRRTYRRLVLVAGILWTVAWVAVPAYTWLLRRSTYGEEVRLATLLVGAAFALVGVGLVYAGIVGEFVEEDGTTKLAVGEIKLEF